MCIVGRIWCHQRIWFLEQLREHEEKKIERKCKREKNKEK